MKRILLATLVTLFLSIPAVAQNIGEGLPKHTKKQVIQKIVKVAAITAPMWTAPLHSKGGIDCRKRNGVEPCTAHYGEFRGTEIANAGLSVAMSAITWGCLRENDWKGCYTFSTGMVAYNVYWWRHEEGIRVAPDKIGQ